MDNTNKVYCIPDDELEVIFAEFFVERKWERYYTAIKLMEKVKFSI